RSLLLRQRDDPAADGNHAAAGRDVVATWPRGAVGGRQGKESDADHRRAGRRLVRAVATACSPQVTDATVTAALSETEQRNLRSVTDVLQYWNRQDLEGVLAYYDDSITWLNIAMEETYRGKNEVRAFLRRLFGAFPDLNFEVT